MLFYRNYFFDICIQWIQNIYILNDVVLPVFMSMHCVCKVFDLKMSECVCTVCMLHMTQNAWKRTIKKKNSVRNLMVLSMFFYAMCSTDWRLLKREKWNYTAKKTHTENLHMRPSNCCELHLIDFNTGKKSFN